MKVFLDTNIFYNNWFVSNANFKLFYHYLNNNQHELLLSELVVQEVNNIRERELSETISEIKRLIKNGSKLNATPFRFNISDLGINNYNIKEILKSEVHWVKSIDYNSITQSQVVERALKLIKPFTDQEKGYRDTLIWLSFLNYLKENDIQDDVAFITNNKSDFFKAKNNPVKFNDDLESDIKNLELKAKIIPYKSLFDFVNDKADKIVDSVNKYEILDRLEGFLIDATEDHISVMRNEEISDLLNAKVFSEKITSVLNIEADIFEGLEDPDVKSVSSISKENVYINCYYEMRRVDIIITIDKIEYKQYADELESIDSFYNIELDDDIVKLSFIVRLYIDASLEYDIKTDEASNLTIEGIYGKG